MVSQNTLSIESVSTGCAWKVHTFFYVKRTHTHFSFQKQIQEEVDGKRQPSRTHVEGNCHKFPYSLWMRPSRPLIHEWRKYAETVWPRTHRTLPLLLPRNIVQNNSWTIREKKTRPFAYVAAQRLMFFSTHTKHTQELNLYSANVVCGSGWMNGMVWMDSPIKSAATNVLNGFKMSFWCVFFSGLI